MESRINIISHHDERNVSSDDSLRGDELNLIQKDGKGGLFISDVQSALQQIFSAHKEVYVPDYNSYSGFNDVLPIQLLKEQGYQYVAFSFAVDNEHQVAIWITLNADKPIVSIYDSKESGCLKKESLDRLQSLLGHEEDYEIIMEKSPYKTQVDDWSCGVYVIAHLKAVYFGELEPNIDKQLDVTTLANNYLMLSQLKNESKELQSQQAEKNDAIKRVILAIIEEFRSNNGFYNQPEKSTEDQFYRIADYLQRMLWGNVDRGLTPNDNTGRVCESSESERTKSLPDTLLDYQSIHPDDELGKLILQLAYIYRDLSTEELTTIFQKLFIFMEANRLQNANRKSLDKVHALLDTELQLALNQHQTEQDQHLFLQNLCNNLLSNTSATERFHVFLKQIDADGYVGDTQDSGIYLRDNETITLNGEEYNSTQVVFDMLKTIAQRAIEIDKSIEHERKRMGLEKLEREKVKEKKISF